MDDLGNWENGWQESSDPISDIKNAILNPPREPWYKMRYLMPKWAVDPLMEDYCMDHTADHPLSCYKKFFGTDDIYESTDHRVLVVPV